MRMRNSGQGLQRYDEALDHFRKALELDPHSALAHHDIGWVLGAEGKYPEAIKEFERPVQICPSSTTSRQATG